MEAVVGVQRRELGVVRGGVKCIGRPFMKFRDRKR